MGPQTPVHTYSTVPQRASKVSDLNPCLTGLVAWAPATAQVCTLGIPEAARFDEGKNDTMHVNIYYSVEAW